MALSSVEAILDFAIQKEQEAFEFYTDLASRAPTAWMRQAFEQFAGEERGHKAKLQNVRAGGQLLPAARKVQDLKVADYLIDVEPAPDLDYQQALIVAMKAEKAAFRLYTDLAAATDDAGLRDLLEALAQEEARHKLRFEVEYDEVFLKEN